MVIDSLSVVLEVVASYSAVPPGGVRPHHLLVADLHMDGDDYAMGVVPELERRLSFKARVAEWEQVYTVQDVLTLVKRYVT